MNPTELVSLWLHNNFDDYTTCTERACEVWEMVSAAPGDEFETRSASARFRLATSIRDHYANEAQPEVPGVYRDLLTYALADVAWFDIADEFLADLDGYVAKGAE